MYRIKPLLVSLLVFASLAADAMQFTELTLLVSSCDKYAAFWTPFVGSLFKNWPSLLADNSQLPILMIANHRSVPHFRIKTINIPNEKSWADNMLTALDEVKTKYVMVVLDDYWINEPVNEQRLHEVYLAMQRSQAAMLQLSNNDPRFHKGPELETKGVIVTDRHAHYKASLQLAIWDVEALKTILRPGEDPWTFELAGTARSHGYPAPFLSLAKDEPIHYINASHQGHINPAAIEYAKNNNMLFEPGSFPILGTSNYKLIYKKWKKRVVKLIEFARSPGLFYKS